MYKIVVVNYPEDRRVLRARKASRASDDFETNPLAAAKKTSIEDHSRFGKAIWLKLACDHQFAVVFENSFNEDGARLHQRNTGEMDETGLMDADLTFRQHSGGHSPEPNQPTFLNFASRYFN